MCVCLCSTTFALIIVLVCTCVCCVVCQLSSVLSPPQSPMASNELQQRSGIQTNISASLHCNKGRSNPASYPLCSSASNVTIRIFYPIASPPTIHEENLGISGAASPLGFSDGRNKATKSRQSFAGSPSLRGVLENENHILRTSERSRDLTSDVCTVFNRFFSASQMGRR